MKDIAALMILGLVLFLSTKRDGRARFTQRNASA